VGMTEGKGAAGYYVKIQDLPTAERPRERLRNYGSPHLSNAELLSIMLRTAPRPRASSI